MTLYTKREVCEQLKISERTLERMLAAGEIDAYRVGGQVRISDEHIEYYLLSNRLQPTVKKVQPQALPVRRGSRKKQPQPVYVPGMKVV